MRCGRGPRRRPRISRRAMPAMSGEWRWTMSNRPSSRSRPRRANQRRSRGEPTWRQCTATPARPGPDDGAVWVDAHAGVALGHRRLSIIDLSPAGSQPMRSASGRYVLTFNGEIYNHSELRRDLLRAGTTFRGTCDTEVFLEAIAS